MCFQAMASTEERAYEIMRELDVSYVLVIFGGLTGYSSDGNAMFLLFPLKGPFRIPETLDFALPYLNPPHYSC